MTESIAFRLSGRFSVTVRTPPARSTRMRSGTERDFHSEQCGGEHLPLGVGLEGHRAPATQGAMQEEVERVEVRQLVPLHLALDNALEMPGDTRGRHLLHQDR